METGLHMRSPKIDRPLNSLPMAKGTIGEGQTRDHNHLGSHPLCRTKVLKAIGVQTPQHVPYHPGWTVQMVLGIQDKAGGIRRKLA